MMKSEFEQRIGKTVAWETWERYEAMYMAIDVDKDAFVAMLNVDAIPEDQRAVEARAEAEAIREEKRQEVKRLRLEIADAEAQAEWYKNEAIFNRGYVSDSTINYYKMRARDLRNHAKTLRGEVKTIKLLWGV